MGNKYAKLFVIMVAILLLSIFQYQELKAYYTENLPYISVNQYRKSLTSSEQKGPVSTDLLHSVATTEDESYGSEALESLAISENEGSAHEEEESVQVTANAKTNESSEKTVTVADKDTIAKTDLKLNAVASVLMDGDSQRVLYGEHQERVLAMASTTKIMTCIVALENGTLDDVVTVSKYAAKMPDVQLNISAGEQYYLGDLLYSLMLESHNDSAVAIAEHIGGTVEGFADMMNAKAKELGCTHTQFVTPNGLDAEGHYTTAEELAKIACYAIQNEKFIEITNTASHEFKELTKEKKMVVTNKNRFLYMMEGAIGVKTGFTNNAGYCFVGAIKRDDRTFVSVVLGSGWPPHKSYKWNDTTTLMNYGLNNYQKYNIMNKKVELPEIYVENGQQSTVKIFTEGNLSLLLREDEAVKAEYCIPSLLTAPVVAGEEVGKLNFYIDNVLFTSFPIYTDGEVASMDLKFCINKVLDGFCWMKH